jgi:glycosyltransferase involved in cell wall biosynthesis
MPPTVSVIIPCYNREHFLGGAIESVLRQSYRDFEIVVVDDGSTDGTAEVAARYEGVRLVRQTNCGVSAARNAGLRESAGEYLVFLDSDDLLLPEALKTGVDLLEAHPEYAFVYGHCEYIGADGSLLPPPRRPKTERDCYAQLLRQNHIQSVAAVMFRRRHVDGFRAGMDGCEDRDLYLRLAKEHRVHCHGRTVFQYRRHDSNLSNNTAGMINSGLAMFKSHLELVRGDERLERLCRSKIRELERELAGKRNLKRDLSNIIQLAGNGMAKLFGK